MVLAACGQNGPGAGTKPSPSGTRTLPTPIVNTTSAPDPEVTAKAFLDAWKAEDYARMYSYLTGLARDAISEDNFAARYKSVAINMTLSKIDYSITSALVLSPNSAQVAYRVVYHTNMFPDITRDNLVMNLSLNQQNQWQVQWDDGMILPELHGGNTLRLDYKVPARGNIYDRNGHAIASQAEAVALGIVPGEIGDGQEGSLVSLLSRLTGKSPDAITASYQYAQPDWYIPVGEATIDAFNKVKDALSNLGGWRATSFRTRYYDGPVAPQAVGYVQAIPKDELDQYRRLGYAGDERVGASGLEKWGEQYLAGKHGGSLYVVDTQGQIVTRLAETDPQPAESIYTTLDKDLELGAQKSLGGFNGAVVVLERDTGRVLAMASSPGFDPNLFEPANYNSNYQLGEILNDPNQPLLNRAAQGVYPPGSIFKVITMSAALQSGLYTADTTYNCTHEWTELPNLTLYDWTYTWGFPPSGLLTLPEGLMRSCNPFFWHIGLDLFRHDYPTIVTDTARGFGLGSATGIDQVAESTGSVPQPTNEGEAIQQAIGQGAMQVTPLQVADYYAAIGNGGTLYRPQLVEKITTPDGNATYTFQPEVRGKLPVSPENLKIVQDAMRSVVENKRGTAYYTFLNIGIPVYGKTGTAETAENPHSWFAGYTNANNPDKPDIAIAVVVENAGEGSEIAAPIFRRMVELYFLGKPIRLFPWESTYYVTRTPTPLYTDTSVPEATATPTP